MNSDSLPKTWELVSIKEVAEINPRAPVLPLAHNSPVPFVPMSAVSEEFGGIDISKKRPLSEVQKGYTSFTSGDVLFAKITPCMENGKLAIVPELSEGVGYGSTEFHVLRSAAATTSIWLAWFLSQAEFRRLARQNMTGSAGQLRVSTSWLSTTKIPVAPLAEQTRIVAKLEELLSDLDAGVSELKAAQRKLTQYRQSLLKAAVEGALTAEWRASHEVKETGAQLLDRILEERRARWEARQLAKFREQGKVPPKDWQDKYPEPVKPETVGLPTLPEGWVWASMDCLLDGIETGKSFKCEERPPIGKETGVVKVSAVSWGEYDDAKSKTCIDPGRIDESLLIDSGDFLFSRANTIELVGACVIARLITKRVMLSDKILRFKFVMESLKGWALSCLRSELGRKQIEGLASGNQESMRNIGQERIRQIAIPLPSFTELDEAAALLESGLGQCALMEQSLLRSMDQSAAQRKNILKVAFSGQLVPQDPNDEPASVLLERIRAERTAAPNKVGKLRKGRKTRTGP